MRVLMVDGNNILFQHGHALSRGPKGYVPLSTSDGRPTGAIFGTLKCISNAIDMVGPDMVVVAWDGGSSSYRKAIYPEYKAGRKERRESDPKAQAAYMDIIRQIPMSQEIFPDFAMAQATSIHQEADDVLYRLGIRAMAGGHEVVVMSGDKDLLQMVNHGASFFHPTTNKLINKHNFESHKGVLPQYWVMYLAIVGDSSDNIPGVPGAGEITAKQWLSEFYPSVVKSPRLMSSSAWRAKLPKRVSFIPSHMPEIARNVRLIDLSLNDTMGRIEWTAPRPWRYSEAKRWCEELEFDSILGQGELMGSVLGNYARLGNATLERER